MRTYHLPLFIFTVCFIWAQQTLLGPETDARGKAAPHHVEIPLDGTISSSAIEQDPRTSKVQPAVESQPVRHPGPPRPPTLDQKDADES